MPAVKRGESDLETKRRRQERVERATEHQRWRSEKRGKEATDGCEGGKSMWPLDSSGFMRTPEERELVKDSFVSNTTTGFAKTQRDERSRGKYIYPNLEAAETFYLVTISLPAQMSFKTLL